VAFSPQPRKRSPCFLPVAQVEAILESHLQLPLEVISEMISVVEAEGTVEALISDDPDEVFGLADALRGEGMTVSVMTTRDMVLQRVAVEVLTWLGRLSESCTRLCHVVALSLSGLRVVPGPGEEAGPLPLRRLWASLPQETEGTRHPCSCARVIVRAHVLA
jgi:hypothetical protein